MKQTRRQEIVARLSRSEWSFQQLRHDLELTVKVLEEDLRHIVRSVRSTGGRLEMRGAQCLGCGFVFSTKALHPPGRCPACRERRIDGPWLQVRS